MRNELDVERVELLARRGFDRRGERQVVPGRRASHFERRGVEIGRVALDDFEDRLREAVAGAPHDLDRETARELEQADLRRHRLGGARTHVPAPVVDAPLAFAATPAATPPATRAPVGAGTSLPAPATARRGPYIYSRVNGCGSLPSA